MFYNRYREDGNPDKVIYINKEVVEEVSCKGCMRL